MKKYLLGVFLILGPMFLSGCSLLNNTASKTVGGVLKTEDGGANWEFKNKIDDKKNISGIDVLKMVIDPVDTNRLYLGTRKKGIVFSTDGAESWKKMKFPADNVYGIGINRFRPEIIYASGVYKKRGKIFKSENYGTDWKEIYTESADGTIITALAISDNKPDVLYAGTSEGTILKTVDAGKTWRKLYNAKAIISQILFDKRIDETVYFVIYKKNLIVTKDGGSNFQISKKRQSDGILRNDLVFSVAGTKDGNIYLGTNNGLFKSSDQGEIFEKINILSDSKKFPVRSITINPKNSQEIVYGAAQVIYKSVDGGKHWSTLQLDTEKVAANILFNPDDSSIIYASLRSFNK